MMSADDAFAKGFRLAWRNVPLITLLVVLGFLCIAALGYFFDLIETSNAVRRSVQ